MHAVAAVYPLAWLAEQVAPEAEVELLNQGSQEAHDIQITPQQRAAVQTADVVLYLGEIDYQPQVEEAVAAAEGQVVSAAEVAGEDALLPASADPHAHEEEAGTEGEHGHEEESATEEHAEDEQGGGEAGVDPHMWFDPAIMADAADEVAEAFAAADPDSAETYRDNAAEVREDLTTLEEDLEATLGGQCRLDEAIVSHAAYGYLLQPHGKSQHALTNVGAEGDAPAAELGEIVGEIRAEGITHVLAEPVEGRDAAETVAREAGVELLEIVPLDAVTDEQAATGLPDLVREQADAFATALDCA
ncbi:metal ABC transporter substrate-binding protein [Sediminivirga luteola]|uniref:metal ABC transporter substrate-binding protein n=1 Tax=Sediminivirga luteola TaxID=1774748 RepID=UPI001F5865F9|nr:metal ABC transporter substrate-binding protein [Sediminivirga luteola]